MCMCVFISLCVCVCVSGDSPSDSCVYDDLLDMKGLKKLQDYNLTPT